MPERKIAFVVPWYGVEVVGGAETMARRIAENLADRGVKVEVLTTCAGDSGSQHDLSRYPKGESIVNGVVVRRFEATAPASSVVDEVLRKLKREDASPEDEESFLRSLFNSPRLIEFIANSAADYRYVFTPYWCGTTFWGSKASPEASYIIPCLHEEPMARIRSYGDMFRGVRGLLCYSQPEMDLAIKLCGIDPARCALIGGAIDAPGAPADPERFRTKYNLQDDFVLCIGRKADNKNTPLLVNYFTRYKQRHGGRLKLALVGPGRVDIPDGVRGDIIDLGILPEAEKNDAYAAAMVLCQPSVNESFSIVLMEAWVQGTPVLVHARCDVTRGHCIESNGGLFFRDYPEFEGCLQFLQANESARRAMGASGREFVARRHSWDRVIERFRNAIDTADQSRPLLSGSAQ